MEDNYSQHQVKATEVTPSGKAFGIDAFIYALISVVIGYLFVRWTFGPALGIGIFVFTCLYLAFAVTFRAIHDKEIKNVTFQDAAGFLAIFLLGGVQLISDNAGIKFFCYYVEIHAVLYWLLHFFRNREAARLDGAFFLDSLKAIWIMPFGSFGSLFSALFSAGKGGKKRKVFGYILLGLLVALIPTAIVLFLLMAGDALFESFFENLFENLTEEFFTAIMRFILSVPVSMYIFGALWSNGEHLFPEVLDRSSKERVANNARFLHPVISCTAMVPVLSLYVIYVVLHVGYYFSAFRNIVPEGYSTAEFARRGFFELCIVAMINLIILLAGAVFTKRREDGARTAAWRVFAVLLSVMTMALSASAISKMLLYIRLYGLTQKRVITMWVMFFLMLTFLYVIIRQFTERFNVWAWSITTGLVMLLIIGYVQVDTVIAGYNIDAWKQGKLETVDVEAIGELSDAVTPQLIKLAGEEDEAVSDEARRLLFIRSLEEKEHWCHENLTSLFSYKRVKAYEAELEADGEQENTRIQIKLINHSDEEIAELRYAYYLNGTMVRSGGALYANGDPYIYGDAIWLDEIFEKAVADDIHVELSVVLPGEEETEHYLGMIYPAAHSPELVTFHITGDRYEGFRLEAGLE